MGRSKQSAVAATEAPTPTDAARTDVAGQDGTPLVDQLVALGLFVVTCAVYHNALKAKLVFDDYPAVENNKACLSKIKRVLKLIFRHDCCVFVPQFGTAGHFKISKEKKYATIESANPVLNIFDHY